jgi:hypothetical protein
MASAKEDAPVGMIMNSWKASALPAWHCDSGGGGGFAQ